MGASFIKKIHIDEYVGEDYNPFTQRFEPVYEDCGTVVVPEDKSSFCYNKKIIVSGNVVEVYEYGRSIGCNLQGDNKILHTGKKKSNNDKSENNLNRSKKKLRRLINSNVSGNDLFVTLTYKDNMTDIKQCKLDFKKFIMRWNYRRRDKLMYVYVVEFQKRGAVHFHCIFFNVGFISNKELSELWGHGFVKVNDIDNFDNVGSYVVKYMQKDLIDDRLRNSDLYGRSKGNLKEPVEIKKPSQVVAFLDSFSNEPSFCTAFCNEYLGYILYKQYK